MRSGTAYFDPWAEIARLREGAAKVAKAAKEATLGDLLYPLDFVRAEAALFTPPYAEAFRHWRQVFEREEGYAREDAERAAFRRVLRSGPLPLRWWAYTCPGCRSGLCFGYRPPDAPRCRRCRRRMEARS